MIYHYHQLIQGILMKPGLENEIELKFLLTKPLADAIKASGLLPIIPGSHEHDPIANYYYDTTELDLQQRGFALRLRKKKEQFIQSLKGGGYNDHALHSRQEWNQFIPDLNVVPAILTDTPVFDLVKSGKIHDKLKPLFLTDIQRELWHARWQQSIVEIAFDHGFIVVGEQRQAMNELEIELVEGQLEDLIDLAKTLQQRWQLEPIEVSKAAKGYAFLASLKQT